MLLVTTACTLGLNVAIAATPTPNMKCKALDAITFFKCMKFYGKKKCTEEVLKTNHYCNKTDPNNQKTPEIPKASKHSNMQ